MKKNRWDILIDLYDGEIDGAHLGVTGHIVQLVWGSHIREIPYSQFKQVMKMIDDGDLTLINHYHQNGMDFIDYQISPSGKQALEALPNFNSRLLKTKVR